MGASSSRPPDSGSPLLQLEVNGKLQRLEQPSSVAALLETLDLGSKRVAVAVNREVVVRSRYKEVQLADGDRVEILEAVGGG